MRAAVIDRFGGPQELHLADVPTPAVGPTDVLIEVHAAGLGSWDKDERAGGFEGEYATASTFPYILGWDGSGIVAAVGADVDRFAVGDRVFAATTAGARGGFYAEFAVVDQKHVAHVPDGIPLDQAGAMAWDALTAMGGLETLALKRGESLVIFGAGGGIGHLAVQLARRWGVRVLAVASGADGVALAGRLGADAVVDGRSSSIADAARAFAPDGVDAALLTAGGAASDEVLAMLKPGGRAACPYGVEPEPGEGAEVAVQFYGGDRSADGFARLLPLISDGDFEVSLSARHPLSQAAQAHEALAAHYTGKMVLLPREGA